MKTALSPILVLVLAVLACSSKVVESDTELQPDVVDAVPQDALDATRWSDLSGDSVPMEVADLEPSTDAPELVEMDSVELLDNLPLDAVDQVETLTCDCAPPSLALTVNRIPQAMNGSTTYTNNAGQEESFYLLLPTFDFTVDLTVDCPCGCAAQGIALTVQHDGTPAQLDIPFEPTDDGFSGTVTEESLLPDSLGQPGVTLEAAIEDECGQLSPYAALAFATITRTPQHHPFDLEDWWLMVHHRDYYTITLDEAEDGSAQVESVQTANGVDDFLEDLWLVGLGTADPTASFAAYECEHASGGSACIAWELLERIRTKAFAPLHCDGNEDWQPGCVPLRFAIEGEPGAPAAADFTYENLDGTETVKSFSMIGLGGGDLTESLVGLSESIDVLNDSTENNARFGYGCFTSSLMRYFYKLIGEDPSLYALAEMALAPILPPMGGVPIGELEGDERVIDFSIPSSSLSPVEKTRRLTLDTTIDILATGLAALMVHEIGHSIGLVPYHAPPKGLFGEAKLASFVVNPAGSTGAHIDTEGPNLMQSGPGSGNMNSIDPDMLFTPFFFNELNLAYLRGRVIVTK